MKIFASKWTKAVICGIILILFYKFLENPIVITGVFSKGVDIFMPLIVGLVIAFFTYRPSKAIGVKLKKSKNKFISKHSLGIGILAVYLLLVLIVAVAIMFIAPKLYKNAEEFIINFPSYFDAAEKFVSENAFISKYVSFDNIEDYLVEVINFENMNRWVGVVGKIASSFMTTLVSLIVSIYLIIEKEDMFRFFRDIKNKVIKSEKVSVVVLYIRRIINVFYSYMSGMVIDGLVMGVITTIVLTLFGVPYSALLGLVVAIGNMIPFFGAIISNVVIIVISIITIGPIKSIGIIVAQFILGQVDGNVIQPKILSSSTGISPLLVLLSVLVFGDIFGVVGMVIGVPLCAAIKMIVLDYLDDGELNGSVNENTDRSGEK